MMMKNITEHCEECHGTDLWQGFDVMIPLEKLHDGTLTGDDYADGSFNEYVWCNGCDDECMGTYTKEVPCKK
jgi:hypothetical protein